MEERKTSPIERLGSCVCGQLSIRCRGEPELVSSCHCFACQRRTGSLFGVSAFYRRDNILDPTGRFSEFRRRLDSGRGIAYRFCPVCGSTVFWEPDMLPDCIGVAVGAFADPAFHKPARAVWTANKHHWLELPADMTQIQHGV